MKPRQMARLAFQKLPRSVLYELFYQSARALGIRSFEATGAAGSFFGPIYDQAIIRTYLETGSWSPNVVDLFARFFAGRGGTMYDVGANVGLISVPLAANPQLRVVAFEPDPHNAMLLRANIAAAGVNVEVVHAAVANEPGFLKFARSKYNGGDHRLSADGEISVPTVRRADFVPAPVPFAVKIDTQGAEPLIVQGGAKVLAGAGLIVCEFWPWGMRRYGLTSEPILAFAENHFKRGFILRQDQPAREPMPIGDVLATLRSTTLSDGEYDVVDLVLMQ